MAKQAYVYSGTDWVPLASEVTNLSNYQLSSGTGLNAIIPTSVTVGSGSGSANTVGQVSFSSASSVSLNGVFTSTYDNYLIMIDVIGSTALDLSYRLRVGGVDNSSAVYARQYLFANSSTVSAGRATTNTSWPGPTTNGTARAAAIIEVFGPFLTRVTGGNGRSLSNYSGSPESVYEQYGHNSATSFDGITILASTGNITGTVTVYGYKD